MKIHLFAQNGMYILLDVNSGAVHTIDEMVYAIMQIFDGKNDEQVLAVLGEKYDQAELQEALAELHGLIEQELLFAPDIDEPPVFAAKPIVKSLCLHVAHDCNLRCEYCFAGTGDFGHSRGLMTPEIGKKAVDFLIEHGGKRRNAELDFFGGEPLLAMDTVKEVVAYVRQREQETGKKFNLTLTTNATLLDQEIIDYLNANNIAMVLSLDGRKETHDRMRPCVDGSGSFDEIVANAKKLVDSRDGQNYYLRGTFTAYNPDFAADVAAMADLGFKRLSVEPVVAKEAAYALTEEHLPVLFAEYEKLADDFLSRKLNGNGYEFFHFNLDINNGPCVAKRLAGCGAGHEYFAVTPDGDLYPCHQFVGRENYQMGNVFEGLKAHELSAHFRSSHVLTKPACRECWARFYCSGGCHANADLFHGDIRAPYEVGCELQKKRLECALYIQANLASLAE
ncbi:radical SAM protein [Anaerosporomusa subterranea]|uniref:Radical SAM protein n=1 Tax=Anaerosporomusa subterranea TaxID=1794912 RepID=A0A154BSR8_ANASB|nr:thioether cross-link-forming SCIFF peptide maturase [Anaerosporomusa subterranea]KYZ76558.1 radical SAM protein [Anaerosporomusa subterranea]